MFVVGENPTRKPTRVLLNPYGQSFGNMNQRKVHVGGGYVGWVVLYVMCGYLLFSRMPEWVAQDNVLSTKAAVLVRWNSNNKMQFWINLLNGKCGIVFPGVTIVACLERCRCLGTNVAGSLMVMCVLRVGAAAKNQRGILKIYANAMLHSLIPLERKFW